MGLAIQENRKKTKSVNNRLNVAHILWAARLCMALLTPSRAAPIREFYFRNFFFLPKARTRGRTDHKINRYIAWDIVRWWSFLSSASPLHTSTKWITKQQNVSSSRTRLAPVATFIDSSETFLKVNSHCYMHFHFVHETHNFPTNWK